AECGAELEQVVGGRDQGDLRLRVLSAASEESCDPAVVLDLRKHRFHDRGSSFVRGLARRSVQFGAHRARLPTKCLRGAGVTGPGSDQHMHPLLLQRRDLRAAPVAGISQDLLDRCLTPDLREDPLRADQRREQLPLIHRRLAELGADDHPALDRHGLHPIPLHLRPAREHDPRVRSVTFRWRPNTSRSPAVVPSSFALRPAPPCSIRSRCLACLAAKASRSACNSSSNSVIRPDLVRGSANSCGSSSPRACSPNNTSSCASTAPASLTIRCASSRNVSNVRFCFSAALAANRVESTATVPAGTIPARSHNASTSKNNSHNSRSNRARNRAIVV